MSYQTVGPREPPWIWCLNGPRHKRILCLYMAIVSVHWLEHIAAAYQVHILDWPPQAANGALGMWLPRLVESEILRFTYSLLLLIGLILLRPGFQGRTRRWWNLALIFQTWHFFEHLLLQLQWLTGRYLFGAARPTSVLQIWIPRTELHFLYTLIVFAPMVVAIIYYANGLHFVEPGPGKDTPDSDLRTAKWLASSHR